MRSYTRGVGDSPQPLKTTKSPDDCSKPTAEGLEKQLSAAALLFQSASSTLFDEMFAEDDETPQTTHMTTLVQTSVTEEPGEGQWNSYGAISSNPTFEAQEDPVATMHVSLSPRATRERRHSQQKEVITGKVGGMSSSRPGKVIKQGAHCCSVDKDMIVHHVC